MFVHDPDGQFIGWPRYASPKAWYDAERAAAADGKEFPLVARFGRDAKAIDCLRLGAAASARSGYVIPSLVVMDEGSALYGKARREVFDEEFLGMVTRRRNLMLGTVILSQWVTMLHYLMIANSTELHLMRLEDRRQATYLDPFLPDPVELIDGRKAPREPLLAALPRLERGACYTVKRGF